MNKYIIMYETNSNRSGFALVYAPNPNTALQILSTLGSFREESYKITSIEEDKYNVCVPNTIVVEGASAPNNQIIVEKIIYVPDESIPYKERNRITDFLYTIILKDSPDYKYAKLYFSSLRTIDYNGGCSAFTKGIFHIRNFDYYYNNAVEFIIKTPATPNNHAVLGIASYQSITRDNINDYSLYKILPFYLVDGINDAGLCCSINVVPANEEGWIPTTGTTPTVEKRDTICMRMLPRYILDKFSTAQEAVNYILSYISVYSLNSLSLVGFELHITVTDLSSSYIIEFINNEIKIVEANISTNFRRYNTSLNSDNTIDISTVSPFGTGVERFNKISTSYSALQEQEIPLLNFMALDLKYTNTYNPLTNPKWYTEFVGNHGGFTITALDAATNPHIEEVMNVAILEYNNRLRSTGITWHTVHTALYNMLNKTLAVISLEDNNNIYRYSL